MNMRLLLLLPMMEVILIRSINGDPGAGIGTLNVRLVNGSHPLEGRVELQVDGVWGTVCDDGWDYEDAGVICRQLGMPSLNPLLRRYASFGQGTGPVLLVDAQCNGTESRIQDCPSRHGTFGDMMDLCTGLIPYDAGVTCAPPSGPGELCQKSSNCVEYGICVGHKCQCYDSYPNNNVCQKIDVRLVNGSSRHEGRVEVYAGPFWGLVCDTQWGLKDAIVVCNQLGFNSTFVIPWSRGRFGPGTTPVYLNRLQCAGTEDRLVNCRNIWYSYPSDAECSTHDNVGVTCGGTFEVRLVNGSTPAEGRVEVAINGEWGTVCNGLWDERDALVVCRQLGLPSERAIAWDSSQFGQGSGHVWMNYLSCEGTEDHLLDCPDTYGNVAMFDTMCPHSYDVGVTCIPPAVTSPPPGGPGDRCNRVGEMMCVGHAFCNDNDFCQCDVGYHPDTISSRCHQIGEIRLMDGRTTNEGRVEVWNGTVWGSVCDDYWDVRAATVVCRQLGLNSTAVLPWGLSHFGVTTGLPVVMHSVSCSGSEHSLLHCQVADVGHSVCNDREEAGVTCGGTMNLRLVGGYRRSEGRVEIEVDGVWGTVCDRGWDARDAAVVCRQLGLPSNNADPRDYSSYGRGRGPIYLQHVQCAGTENSLLECPTSSYGPLGDVRFHIHYCRHYDDAGVSCSCKLVFLYGESSQF